MFKVNGFTMKRKTYITLFPFKSLKHTMILLFFGLMTVVAVGHEPAYAGKAWMPSVEVNLEEVVFPDQAPYIKNDRTMVPVRFVSEALGAKVFWEVDGDDVVTIKKGKDTTILLKLGETTATVNGETKTFDAAAELTEDRVCVPLRFVSEALGADVRWMSFSHHVVISSVPYVVKNGYKIPTSRFTEVNTDKAAGINDGEVFIAILIYGDQDLREKQFNEVRFMLESKLDQKVVNEIMDYIRIKTTRENGHHENLKMIKTQTYTIGLRATQGNITSSVDVRLKK